ncbi:MAG: hypothetical protein J7539_09025 [Niabella sp.]|nr:hypothetical protein [Niabella sp.]
MKNINLLTLILFGCLLLTACRRDITEHVQSIDANQVRKWLHENGGRYKNETVSVKNAEGAVVQGTLNWTKARQYNWEGRDYIDVPFLFQQYGVLMPGNASRGPAAFNMVIRRTGKGGFEGALRTTSYNAPVERLTRGDTITSIIDDYTLITGEKANLWQRDADNKHLDIVYRADLTAQDAANLRLAAAMDKQHMKRNGNGILSGKLLMLGETACNTSFVTGWEYYCYTDASYNPPPGELAQVICVSVPYSYYITTCQPAPPRRRRERPLAMS